MKSISTPLRLAFVLVLLAGCSPSSSDTGSAQLAVSVPQALSASISRVSVTASAADFPSVSVELVSTNGSWGGFLGNLPAGSNRSFLAQAFDASGTKLYEGSASGISITAEQTTLVAITLQQVNPPPPYQNEAPLIDSLTAPSTSVAAGSALTLTAAAHDPNLSDTLTYAWSATAGSFSSATGATTSWTAPASTGIQTLTVIVTDSQGLSSSLTLSISVTPSSAQGTARFSISFNSFPQVISLGASLTRLAVGQSTSISASASDVDGDSLSYSWSASCAGSWSNASSSAAEFTPSALPAGDCNNCRLTVTVSDGRSGQTTGSVNLCVSGPAAPPHFNPYITASSYSSDTATPGQMITYEVAASDPEGSALTFSWAANTGSLNTPVHTASSSRISWTAPACAPTATPPSITATVTNAFNLTATKRFSVTGLPACPPAGWASTGSITGAREAHTATVLLDGKVLVAGGRFNSTYLSTAYVYDPATGTWTATGSMASPRGFYTATRLNNGKVLVTGGNGSDFVSAEVYDPATGTWSTTGSMAWGRNHHTATLLTNGKVLVAGGGRGEVYDPASGTWSAAGFMASSTSFQTATLLNNGKVLVAGGSNSAAAEVYDPTSNSWSVTGAMASARSEHRATLLPDGKVLVTGGHNGNHPTTNYLATAEVYDPGSGTWSSASPMATPRFQHMATLLNNGQVLVAGGYNVSTPVAAAEVYDPVSGTWSAAPPMASARARNAAALLLDGRFLVVGGSSHPSLATAELYTP